MSVLKYETLHFRVQDEFISKHARTLLREEEIDKAISFLKCITDEDKYVSQVLFGKAKFEEIEDTQRFKLVPDGTEKIGDFKIDAKSVKKHFNKKRNHNKQIAECLDIEIPVITGTFSDDKDLDRVLLAYRNYKVSERCVDEIFHPEWFIDYSVGNPKCSLIWSENIKARQLRGEPNWYKSKYGEKYLPTSRVVFDRQSIVMFFEVLTDGFILNTKTNIRTYNPREFVDNYYSESEVEKFNKADKLDKLLFKGKLEDYEESEEIQEMRKKAQKEKEYIELGKFAEKVVQLKEKLEYERKEGKFKDKYFLKPEKIELLNIKKKYPDLADIVDRKLELINEADKPKYYNFKPDDIKMIDGLIDNDGNWYSTGPMQHENFAYDYLKKMGREKTYSCKDELVKTYGWITVTDGMFSIYIIGGNFNKKQRKTLQKWMKKYKVKKFNPIGDKDFYGYVKSLNDSWFNGGRD